MNSLALTPEEEVAYLAGIFDSEGTIATFLDDKYSGVGLQLIVSMFQKDVQLLKWIQQRFGGKFYVMEDGTSRFTWKFNAAYSLLLTIRPYLIVKVFDANEVIEIWESKYDRPLLIDLLVARKARLEVLCRK